MKESIAHITQIDGSHRIQTVREHCRQTAQYAAEAATSIGLRNTAYLAGLLHDMGKCKQEFDTYLMRAFHGEEVKRGTVNHTFAGVIFLFERYHSDSSHFYENMTCEILAFAVASHHGLIDGVSPESVSGYAHRLHKNRAEICYDESLSRFLEQCAGEEELDRLFCRAKSELQCFFDTTKKHVAESKAIGLPYKSKTLQFFVGMTARLVLSALIDADRRDTAEFYLGEKHQFLNADKSFWQERVAYFEEKYQQNILNNAPDTPLNRTRKDIADQAKAFAVCADGIYRMTTKTGAGKTLSSLRFGLNCAALHEKRRIIFVIPLLSILEQNAAVIRTYLGKDDAVLEHHSNVIHESRNDASEQVDRYEMLTESWDSPVIITTLVQMLQTLFSGKPSAVRRMQALSGSVIIFDEIQSLPRKTMYMCNLALDYLARFCGCTIVLSSATQPCFEEMDYPMLFAENADMIKETPEMEAVFRRTEIVDKSSGYGMEIEELVDFVREIIAENSSLLVICNTKRTARELYQQLAIAGKDDFCLYHLSTNMCTQHRRDTLKNITDDLLKKDGRRVVCVSTQLVEAGVDFSFESCIRVKAGLDNIAQAAGRCNRNGEFGKLCKVYVVSLKNEKLSNLPDIAASQAAYDEFLAEYQKNEQKYGNIFSAKSVALFYRKLIRSSAVKALFAYPTKDKHVSMLDMLSDNAVYFRGCKKEDKTTILNQAFRTAGNEFCVFEDDTIDVIVPYNAEAEAIISDLFTRRAALDAHYFQALLKRARSYTISLFDNQIRSNSHMFCVDAEKRFFSLQKEYYDDALGFFENESAAGAICL